MDAIFHVEWAELFVPTHSILEMIVRGTLMYLALFVILRFVMKRQAGSLGIADILVIVLIADAAQNAFSKTYNSITEGVVLVLVIVFWDFVIDWASFKFPVLRPILQRSPLPLITDGKLVRRNMHREFITEEELKSQLRKQGVDDVKEVKLASMEADGHLSVVEYDKSQGKGATKSGVDKTTAGG
jgi:uncharacterized membrane protein YcaP (DUF421 family)